MRGLFKFELMKLFQQKSIYVVGFILFGLISLTTPSYSYTSADYYKPLVGKVTPAKIKLVNKETDKLISTYGQGLVNISDKQREKYGILETFSMERQVALNVQQRIGRLDIQHSRKAQLERSMLDKLHLDTFNNNKAPAETIDFVNTMGLVFSGLMITLGLASIFTREYASGVANYIFTSKLGRRTIVTAKFLAAFCYTGFVVAIWVLYDTVTRLILFGNSGWSSPIQFLVKYTKSPYPFTMLEYFIVQLGTHLLAAIGFAIFVLLISALCRKVLVSFLISGSVFCLPIVWTSLLSHPTNIIIDFSYTNIMKVENLYMTFKTYNLFGHPVLQPVVILSVSAIVSLLFLWGLYRFIRHRELQV
ncbi:ABC transporter permease subunit [Pullulanibacillus sp. KACC 23026]|uniref:ABC transporter permease subunit n=1 Tax=Pullulanibacillus sp. KACC 23026 TaxID=3028315 RepID=UPI0023AEA73E|nr:ABC transporter permease subunit [Pullulanibacillus sp. KACC 23026]WEG10855.1 ABC transporter permease subunit [Pullulanibacillus sp. KACC 23026]